MKTKADLDAIIPTLVELIRNNDHEIGESYYEQDEDGWGRCDDSTTNYLCYEEDGWLIEVTYECCGEWDNDPGDYWTPPSCDLRRAWGEVTEITATHYDEDIDEESEFSEEDVNKLWIALDEELKDIA
ncbi:hypothetical protein ED388_04635 [Muribaculaceae bacterium Isolate-007 (NCI)]|nr:hypothetical protein EEL42_03360 [Muribaculaceae bacterium Isolate-100 (HZI)]RXE66273.1 hypothetical protein ED388_04635 [Muribaculaceae bacterium Isolate-007 (NCI)]